MKTGWIGEEAFPYFKTLLLPDVAEAIAHGEPLTALGLTKDELAVGAIAGFIDGDVFHVCSFYVAPDYRRKGGGHLLLDSLAAVLREAYSQPVQIRISFTVTEPEHGQMITFLEKEGFKKRPDEDQNIYVTTLKAVMGSAFFQKGTETDESVVPFSALSKGQLTVARKKALEADVPIPEEGLFSDTLDAELSMASVKGGEVCAFLVVSCEPEGLVLSCAWNGSGAPATLALLLRACAHRAKEKYPEDTRISCQTVNAASAGIRRLILPDAQPISYTYFTYITA